MKYFSFNFSFEESRRSKNMKSVLVFIFFAMIFDLSSSAANIEITCDKGVSSFLMNKNISTCFVEKIKPGVINRSNEISKCSVNQDGRECSSVIGFQANRELISYFPKKLSTFFPELWAISIVECGLKELHRADLKNFTKLRELHLDYNKIEYLEENLFKNNLNLQVTRN